jgi:histidyl-tRNA synthetase
MILMGARLWDDLGLDGIELQINSLGQPEERAQHRAALITYFEEHAEILDEDAKRRTPIRCASSIPRIPLCRTCALPRRS